MFVHLDVLSFLLDFLKVIHIKLSDEGRKFVVFEILRQNRVFEQHLVGDLKAAAILRPAHNIIAFFVRNYLIDFADKLRNAVMDLQLLFVLNILKWIFNLLEIDICLKRHVHKW